MYLHDFQGVVSATQLHLKHEKKFLKVLTKKARKAVWMRIEAHSCLTTIKSLAEARTTVAKATTYGESESTDTDNRSSTLGGTFSDVVTSSSDEELLHNFHFLLFPVTIFCCKLK